jgi:hypothetical protein
MVALSATLPLVVRFAGCVMRNILSALSLAILLLVAAPARAGGSDPEMCLVFAAADSCQASLLTYAALTAPVPAQHSPGTMSGMTPADEMRSMSVAMGAMAGYMVAVMPVTVSAVAAAAIGGYAAAAWYDYTRPHP